MKIVVVILLLMVIISLFSGLYFVLKDKGDSKRAVKALTFRVIFSVSIFLLLIAGLYFGWLPAGR
jgi:Protein of unknown function (DUF2909)